MESGESNGLTTWQTYLIIHVIRPFLAILFVLSLIIFSWFVAWKSVLVHVPLVQEIFGLKKKVVKPKPLTRHRLTKFYNQSLRKSKSAEEESS